MQQNSKAVDREDEKGLLNLGGYVAWLPFVGMIVSVFSVSFMLFRQREWSVFAALYTFIPIVAFTFLAILGHLLLRKYIPIKLPFNSGKVKYITLTLALLFAVLQFVFYFVA